MSVRCEQPLNELTLQVWLLFDHPNFKLTYVALIIFSESKFVSLTSLLQSHIFKDVISENTWKTVLTNEQRNHLMVSFNVISVLKLHNLGVCVFKVQHHV